MKRIIPALFVILLAAPALRAAAPREVMDQDVDRSVEELKRFLYGNQDKNGGWPNFTGRDQVPDGGVTALAMFALMEAGEPITDARIKKGIEALAAIKADRTTLYVIAFRVMVLSQVIIQDKDSVYREQLKQDVKYLSENKTATAASTGAWGYKGPEVTGDNSCSQIALLALWEADLAGVDIDTNIIKRAEQIWAKRQQADGGWTYAGIGTVKGDSTSSMTSAALASLFICRDVVNAATYTLAPAVDKAWDYLSAHLTPKYIENGYLAFCVQRVGMTTGRKFIAKMDWFAEGAARLCEPRPAGRNYGEPLEKGLQPPQWGPVIEASFELIFLSRGRIPLTFNKLQHGEEKDWNFHNRDVPRFTEYMRRNYEMRMRWQVVDINDDVQLLLDAPVLLVTGVDALALTDSQWAKLKEYSLRGGMILMIPTNGSKEFLESAKAGLEKLYASEQAADEGKYYKLAKLPADHPIYTSHTEKIEKGDTVAPFWGVSDGSRVLAAICERDLPKAWQKRDKVTGKIDYQLGVSLYFYATGGNPMRTRMRPVFAGKGTTVTHHVNVAWLQHGGNGQTQPYALDYLSQKLTAENRVDLVVKTTPIDAAALKGCQVAWMTGTDAFELPAGQIKDLREWIRGGGMIFVNAVGGSKEFNASAVSMLTTLFEGENVSNTFVSPDSPLVTGKAGDFRGPPIPMDKLPRTRAWIQLDPRLKGLALKAYEMDGRIVAVYSPQGIHDVLDGHAGQGAISYMPQAAIDIAANIMLYGYDSASKAPPTTAPGSGANTQPAATTMSAAASEPAAK